VVAGWFAYCSTVFLLPPRPGDVSERFRYLLDILVRFESIIEKLNKKIHLRYRDQLANRYRGL
jgi:hypothetical protein